MKPSQKTCPDFLFVAAWIQYTVKQCFCDISETEPRLIRIIFAMMRFFYFLCPALQRRFV